MPSKARTMSPRRSRRARRHARIAGVAFLALLAASCDNEPAAVTNPPTAAEEVTQGPPPPTPSDAPVDDPATDETEVSGELLAEKAGDETCTEGGDVSRCVGAPWEGDYSMSDPRLSGPMEVTFNFEMGPGDRFRWWYAGALRNDSGTWEGLNLGEIRSSGVHAGEGVWLETGPNAGLEFHEHTYLGPGAVTSQGDMFEVTGFIHPVAVDGWEFDPAAPNGAREAVLAVTRAWNSGHADAAARLYAEDAAFVDTDGSTTVGRSDIASLVERSAEAGFAIELLPPVVVNGNYAAAAFHWTTDEDEGWMLGVFRFDEAGLILQQEVIAA